MENNNSINAFRTETKDVFIGNLGVGSNFPIRIQSMTNTDTLDTMSTVNQCLELVEGGCEMIRIACPGIKHAKNLHSIKQELRKANCFVPLIADVHFNPKVAEIAAQFVEKVRINPGNYIDKKGEFNPQKETAFQIEKATKSIKLLIQQCKKHNTAIRIGSNHGSLSERILHKYGNTPEGMVFSALEFIDICESLDFYDLIISMKSSKVGAMISSTRLLLQKMKERGTIYPIHLGVTEAGSGKEGIIKSACGIGALLKEGIGDTIRVSLTGSPFQEIPVAKNLISLCIGEKKRFDFFNKQQKKPIKKPRFIVVGDTDNADINKEKVEKEGFGFAASLDFFEKEKKEKLALEIKDDSLTKENFILHCCADATAVLLNYYSSVLHINHTQTSDKEAVSLSFDILQALGLRITANEYIACPTCARTLCDVEGVLEEIKNATSETQGYIIGVMGCIVNGPGEMADADFGIVGSGKNKFNLYQNGKLIITNIPQKEVVKKLLLLINN
jgi:(E)-4-hydroxy-3-methylbut-2-enyl-diphosphate synthase